MALTYAVPGLFLFCFVRSIRNISLIEKKAPSGIRDHDFSLSNLALLPLRQVAKTFETSSSYPCTQRFLEDGEGKQHTAFSIG